MLILSSTLFLMTLYIAVDIFLSKQIFIIKNICIGTFSFFSMFLIISGILFAFDVYSLRLTYGICFGLGVLALLLIRFFNYRSIKDISSIKSVKFFPLCLIGILILGLVVSWGKFEFFGMGQDQGVYQTAAFYRVAGHNGLQIDLEGYNVLEKEEDKSYYINTVNDAMHNRNDLNLLGFYPYHTHNHYLHYEPISDISGYFHGIQNYAALLSISGKIFGLSGMLHIQTLVFLVSICLFFIILNYNLKLKIFTSSIITILFTLSPIILWTTKSTLTECFLTLIVISLIYLITSDETYKNKLLWLPVTVFAFFHVSIYTLMPMFVVLFIVLYMQERDKSIIISGLISLAAYIGGFFTMIFSSNGYTLDNYLPLKNALSFLNFSYWGFIIFISLAALAAGVLLITSCFLIKRYDIKTNSKIFLLICKYTMLLCFVFIVREWVITSFFIENTNFISRFGSVNNGMFVSFPHLTIVSYVLLSGFIILPIILYGIIIRKNEIFAEKKTFSISFLFIYCIIIYSAFFRGVIPYYYYYSRYLAPFIPIILVLGAVYIDRLKIKHNVVISSVSLLLTIPFTLFVVFNKDHSHIDWNSFEQVVSAVDELNENDVVLVPGEQMRIFFLPLNALTNSIILPYGNYEILKEKFENSETGNVYLLGNLRLNNYVEFNALSSLFVRQLSPLPLKVNRNKFTLYLSKVTEINDLNEVVILFFKQDISDFAQTQNGTFTNIAVAGKKNIDREVAFSVGSIYDTGQPDNFYDLVIATEVLEHLDNPSAAMKELIRISKKYIIISVPNEPLWCMANMARFKYLRHLGNTPGHINHWSKKAFYTFAGEFCKVKFIRTPFPWVMLLCEKDGNHEGLNACKNEFSN